MTTALIKKEKQNDSNINQNLSVYSTINIQLDFHIYSNGADRLVAKKMSRFNPKDLEIKELEDSLMHTAQLNAYMQEILEFIASNTEENAQKIAQETLEAISVNNNNKKEQYKWKIKVKQ